MSVTRCRLKTFNYTKGTAHDAAGCRPRSCSDPNGEQETSMKKAMAAIRLTASTKGALAEVEQSV